MALNLVHAQEAADRWLWQKSPRDMGRGERTVWHMCRVVYAVARDVSMGNLTLHAMSLVYSTLLSVVPLLALSFSVLKALGVHNQLEPALFQFFAPLGDQGRELALQVLQFVDNIKVGVLGSIGLGFLIYTVVTVVQKVETALNEAWRVPELRSIGQRFSNYLSVILIGPVLVVSALGVSATVWDSDFVRGLREMEALGGFLTFLSRLAPYFLVAMAFSFVYSFVPNARVHLRPALIAGVVAGVAWQTTGLIFASVVVGSTNYEAIYSGFAVGILLLIWLYVSWLILLIGSDIAYYVQHSEQITKRYRVNSSADAEEKAALQIMFWVARDFDQGNSTSVQKLFDRIALPADVARRLITKLRHHTLLKCAGNEGNELVPGRSLDLITLYDLLQAVRRDDDRVFRPVGGLEPEVGEVTEVLDQQRQAVLQQRTLADLVRHAKGVETEGSVIRQ